MSRARLIDRELLRSTLDHALKSPRLRANHNFHSGPEDNPHRFLNALVRGTYCAPHRHIQPPKAESFVVLEGEVLVLLFDDSGGEVERHILGRDGLTGIDIAAGTWHTVACLSETAVCFEVKPGPYDPATDKEFATWAPAEGTLAAGRLLATWLEGS